MGKQECKREEERMKCFDLGSGLAVPKDPGATLKAVTHTSRRHGSMRPVAREPGQFLSVPELEQQCVHGSSDPGQHARVSVYFAQDFELWLCQGAW